MSANSIVPASDRFAIDTRFRGPPQSADGGYVCGRLAAYLGGPVEVTLRRPPPLNQALDVERRNPSRVALLQSPAHPCIVMPATAGELPA